MITAWDAIRDMLVEGLQGVDVRLEVEPGGLSLVRAFTPGGPVLDTENPCSEITSRTIHAELILMDDKVLITNWHTGESSLVDPAEEGFQHVARVVVSRIVAYYRSRLRQKERQYDR